MNTFSITMLVFAFLLSIALLGTTDAEEVRGQVATGDFQWTAQSFAGFYYDIDDNIGTEVLTTTITEGNKLSGDAPYGIQYVTNAQKKDFEFEDWGYYNVIGFMAKKYFAGYVLDADTSPENQIMYIESTDENVLSDEQLLEILIDDDAEMTVTSGTPLKLLNGYELAIRSIDIDGNKVYLELTKDGASVDTKVISPSKDGANMADKTYYYRKDVGDSKSVVIVAVHFKNAFRGADQDLATVDGEWQLSDTPTDVKDDTEYGMMTITSSTPTQVVMENKDNAVTLGRGREIPLMPDISIKVADSDYLRYSIYEEITEPGNSDVRGAVSESDYTWNSQNFPGFYYDLDDNLGTETLTTTITEGNKLSGDVPYGIRYVTVSQSKGFKSDDWGSYYVIGFLGEECFAGYADGGTSGSGGILEGTASFSLLGSGILSRVLIDSDEDQVISLGSTVDLQDGYAIRPTVGTDNKGLLIELLHNGAVVDKTTIIPPYTYVYAADLGPARGVPIIAAHFQEPIFLEGQSYCKADGLWQISDQPVSVGLDAQFGGMVVTDYSSDRLVLENKDDLITLSKNKDILLMDGFGLTTADNDTLRYFIYRTIVQDAGI